MITWSDVDGVVHHATHINSEKRAARLACNRYVEFWPYDVHEDEPLTCLTCIADPLIDPEGWHRISSSGFGSVTTMARLLAQSKYIQQDVDDRWQDIIHLCGPQHRLKVDENNRCVVCGYGQEFTLLQDNHEP